MSNHEFENYLKLIGKLLQLTRGQQAAISEELRDHLESRVAELVDDGVSQQEAVSRAIEEFGDAAIMAKNFQYVTQLKRRRWMMRFATLSMAGLFMVAVLTMAMWPTTARFGTPDTALAQIGGMSGVGPQEIGEGPSAASQLDAQMEQKLKRPVTLIYDQVPWKEVESELEEQFGINIVLDQSAIDDSLTADEPITFDLRSIPLEHGLIMMLKPKNATFIVDHGVMVVISRDNSDRPEFLQTKMYDCRELLNKMILVPSSRSLGGKPGLPSPIVGSHAAGKSSGEPRAVQAGGNEQQRDQETSVGGEGFGGAAGAGEGMGGMGMGSGGLGSPAENIETKDNVLLDLLKSMVQSDSWRENGGIADARIVNGILIVNQTRGGISAVDRMLQDLSFFINSQPGSAKFPVGVEASPKEPMPGAASHPGANGGDPSGSETDKNTVETASDK